MAAGTIIRGTEVSNIKIVLVASVGTEATQLLPQSILPSPKTAHVRSVKRLPISNAPMKNPLPALGLVLILCMTTVASKPYAAGTSRDCRYP